MRFCLIFLLLSPFGASANELSCGKLYYRTLYLDQENNELYIGAMDRIIKVPNLFNISQTDCTKDSMILEPDNVPNCASRGKDMDFECRNHIRVIQKIDENRLYICGTNAHSPKDLVIYNNLTHLARHEFYAGKFLNFGSEFLLNFIVSFGHFRI